MIKRFAKWFVNRKFWQKLMISYMAIFIVPIFIIGLTSYYFSSLAINNVINSALKSETEKTMNELSEKADRCENVLNHMIYNDRFLSLAVLYNSGMVESSRMDSFYNESMKNLQISLPEIESMKIVSNPQSQNYNINNSSTDYNSEWIRYSDQILILKPIVNFYNGENLGIAVITINAQKFFGNNNTQNIEYGKLIYDSNMSNVLTDWNIYSNRGRPQINLFEKDKNMVYFRGSKFIYLYKYIDNLKWSIYYIIPYSVVSKDINSITYTTLMIIAICVIFVVAISITLSLGFTRRIDRIMNEMKRVSTGDLSIKTTEYVGDEIGQLSLGFNNMINKIDTLINDVYIAKYNLVRSELKALQAQINPHFLYNCLDSINWRAILSGNGEISYLVMRLADFYRTALNKGNIISKVSNEILNIKSYLALQLDVHEDSFEITYDIPDEIMEYECINLMLQPIIENSIEHGVENMEDTDKPIISISAFIENEILIFNIFNNGPSITRENAEDALINKKIGYGLANVNERIKLAFGDDYGINIGPYNMDGESGTLCTIKIPAIKFVDEKSINKHPID